MKKANLTIRVAAKEQKVPFWAIAAKLGIHENTFSRRMRKELPKSEKEKILVIIQSLANVPEQATQTQE